MFGYIYKTTNLINDKIYIGKHIWSDENSIDTKYFGSGIYLNNAIKKYGKNNFICEKIDTAECLEELNQKEKYYIKKYDAMNSEIGYNLTRGGDGTYLPGRCLGDSKNPIVRKKISNSLKLLHSDINSIYNSDEYKQRLSNSVHLSHKNGKRLNIYQKISQAKMGHSVSKETRDKIRETLLEDTEQHREAKRINSEKHKNKMWINNGKQQLFTKSDIAQPYLEQGWVRGRLPYSKETIENMKKGNQESMNGRKQKGKIVGIHKGGKNKYIPEPELQIWLDKGYEIGCCKRKQQEVEMRVKHTGVSKKDELC